MPIIFERPILIRYEGLDAVRHEIDLLQLGASLQGAARLIGVASNYVMTGKYVRKSDAFSVRILAARPEAHCYEVPAHVTALVPVLPLLATTGAKMVEHLVAFIFAKLSGRRREMEIAASLMEQSLKEQGATSRAAIDALREVASKMADSHRPAARMFASPVGESCQTASIGAPESAFQIDKPTRDAIDAPEPVEITDERPYRVLISELDLKMRSCKVSLHSNADDDTRYPGEITDPVLTVPNNAYAAAMAAGTWLDVRAKAQIKEGEIAKLFISDATGPRLQSPPASIRDPQPPLPSRA